MASTLSRTLAIIIFMGGHGTYLLSEGSFYELAQKANMPGTPLTVRGFATTTAPQMLPFGLVRDLDAVTRACKVCVAVVLVAVPGL